MTYGAVLFRADRRRLNATTAIGLDEASFVKLAHHRARSYATTVADANHQIHPRSCPPATTSTRRAGRPTIPGVETPDPLFGALDM